MILNYIQPDLKKKLIPYYIDAVASIASFSDYPIRFYRNVGDFFSDWLINHETVIRLKKENYPQSHISSFYLIQDVLDRSQNHPTVFLKI